MEGPRGTKIKEAKSLKELVGLVFRETLWEEYPQLFNEGNLENCRVVIEDGKVVSHIGMTEQMASIFGCQVGVACIGAVSTHPDYRNRGFATKAFHNACAKAYADGIDFMIVSGDRGLYRRAGCRRVGQDYSLEVSKKLANRFDSRGYSLKFCNKDDIPAISRLYRAEPVRFIRTCETYERAFDCNFVMNRPSDFILIKKNDSTRAYLVIQRPGDGDKSTRIAEYAGERSSVLSSLSLVLDHYKLDGLRTHVYDSDTIMQDLLLEKDAELQVDHASGTVLIINFSQFMNRMRPYFENIIGTEETNKLQFLEFNGTYRIVYQDDQVVIPNRGELAHILFGTQEEMSDDRFENGRKASLLLEQALPIPALWYGINYV